MPSNLDTIGQESNIFPKLFYKRTFDVRRAPSTPQILESCEASKYVFWTFRRKTKNQFFKNYYASQYLKIMLIILFEQVSFMILL